MKLRRQEPFRRYCDPAFFNKFLEGSVVSRLVNRRTVASPPGVSRSAIASTIREAYGRGCSAHCHCFSPDLLRDARGQVELWLRVFERYLDEACVGQISEIVDGDFPHTPRGCVAQAWSAAEILRVTIKDASGLTPKRE